MNVSDTRANCPTKKRVWVKPTVTRIYAGNANNSPTPLRADANFSMGS